MNEYLYGGLGVVLADEDAKWSGHCFGDGGGEAGGGDAGRNRSRSRSRSQSFGASSDGTFSGSEGDDTLGSNASATDNLGTGNRGGVAAGGAASATGAVGRAGGRVLIPQRTVIEVAPPPAQPVDNRARTQVPDESTQSSGRRRLRSGTLLDFGPARTTRARLLGRREKGATGKTLLGI